MFDHSNAHNSYSIPEKTLASTAHSNRSSHVPSIVLVKKVPSSTREDYLARVFSQFGHIKSVNLLASKSYAYIEFYVD